MAADMADYETIMKALRAADAAGDVTAAKRLAQMAHDAKAQTAPERDLGQRIYDNVVGDPTDGVTSWGESLGTWLNRAGESATLGVVGDETSAAVTAPIKRGLAAAGLGGNADATYASERDRFRANEEGMSTLGRLSADIAGALVPGAAGAGLIGRAASIPGRIAAGAAAGGASGATYGFMEGEGGLNYRVDDAAGQGIIGALLGGAIPAIGAGVRSVAQGRAARKAVKSAAKNAPTTEALRAEGNALYKMIEDAGVQIKPEAFDRMKAGLLDRLRANTGFDELPGAGSLTPNTARVVNIMDEAAARMAQEPTAALPFRSLDQMRRQAGAAAGNVANKSDQRAGVEVIQVLDDFVQRLAPDDVLPGSDVETLKSAIGKAREVWGRMSKSQLIDDAMERSGNYLSGAASGVRNQFKNILSNKKLASKFTKAEREALRQVTHGSTLDQLINLAGGGLAQMGSIGGGLAMGGPIGGLIGAAAAAGQRALAEGVTMRNAETVRAAIASGALSAPEIVERLAIAGRGAERLTNTGLLGGLIAGQQATP